MAKAARSAAPRKPSRRLARKPAVREGQSSHGTLPRSLSVHDERFYRSGYVDAVAIYGQALRTLQQHRYAKAAELLRYVIGTFPEERELIERSRLYVSLCDRHLTPPVAEPGDTHERLYAATLALNAGEPNRAITYLNRVRADDASNDQALYMLAVAHVERGEPTLAIRYLEKAIEANPENRSLARVDPDLEKLRREEGMAALLHASATRRRSARVARRR